MDGYINGDSYPSFVVAEYSIYQFIYTFHMPLFFLVSGFLFSLAYIDKESGVKYSRLKTQLLDIIVIYIVFSIVMVTFKVFCSGFVNHQASFSELLSIGWKPIAQYWYLYVLAIFYLIHILLVRCKHTILLTIVLLCLSACAGEIVPASKAYTFYQLFFTLPFFFLGTVMQRSCSTPTWGVTLVGLFVASVLCFMFWSESVDSYFHLVPLTPVVNTFIALGFCLFFWKAFSSVKWLDNKALEICGRYCLEIYLTHCFLTAGFRSVFTALGVTNFWLSLVMNTLLSTILPIFFAMALERIGLHDLLFRPVHYLRHLHAAKEKA